MSRNRSGSVWPSDERSKIIEAVTRRRKELGISQRALSLKLSMHPQTISRLENGQRGLDVSEVFAIAAVLELDPYELFNSAR
jgi:transcriptional regulator with XRE-family HTH domain